MHKHTVGLDAISQFDALIDARSPAEYAEDHLPGAISCPVLDNEQRAQIGTLYKQVSPFEARKLGAVLVARNVAHWIETYFLQHAREWRPLVYCWRGGQRSGAFSHILREVGWNAHKLEGGYKAWRRHVVEQLKDMPTRFRYHVISGATGSGKSRVLEALAERGAQVLHLEALAAHKGSVLGGLPDQEQPTQKGFDSALFAVLSRFDPQRPVFVEAESRKIGRVHLPESLIVAIRGAACTLIDASRAARIDFLLRDYDYAIANREWLNQRLRQLVGLQSHYTVERWQQLAQQGQHAELVSELLEQHYDPLYQRSQSHNYAGYSAAKTLSSDDLTPGGIAQLAESLLATSGETSARRNG